MAVSTDVEAPASPGASATGERLWRVAAWVAVAVAVLGHLWVVRSSFAAGTPSFNFDEIQSLMPGRAVLGLPTPQVGGSGYFPFSAILVAPVWLVTSDPVLFYRAALTISLLLGIATIWPLARIATRLGLTMPQAVTVAAVVMALPTRTVQAEYALGEKPLMLVLALTALAAVRLTERPTYARVLLVSGGVALCWFTHARMVTVVVAALVWLLLFTLRHVRIGLVGVVSLVVLAWLARKVALHVILLASPGGYRQDNNFTGALTSLRPGLLARTTLGQAWEQVISTFGLAPLGLVVVLVLVVREARRLVPGPASLLLLAVGALFAGSAIDWARPDRLYQTPRVRLDIWIYGRYVDPLFALVTLVALAAVVVGVRRWQRWLGAAVSVAICALTVLWLAPKAPTGGSVTPAHAPGATVFWWARPDHLVPTGTLPTLTNDTRFWLIASLVALVPVVVLLVVPRRPLVVLGVVLALAAGGTVTANVASGDFHDLRAREQPARDQLVRVLDEHPGTSVSYFWRCADRRDAAPGGRNRYAWTLLPQVVLGTDADADIVIACPGHPAAAQPGAVPLAGRVDQYYLAWVRPGPLQDALRAEGLLGTPPPPSGASGSAGGAGVS